MYDFKKYIKFILSVPRSLVICLKVFPFKEAIHIPMLVSNNCRILEIHRGSVKIDPEFIRPGVFRIGFPGTAGIMPENKKSLLEVKKSGVIYVHGRSAFAEQSALRVSGELHIGDHCIFNTRTMLSCGNKVTIGDFFLGGWDSHIQDTNNHYILYDDKLSDDSHMIEIGNHVWLCARSSMLNGKISDGSIIAYRSVVLSSFDEPNVLVSGYPAKIIKHNVRWIHDKGELTGESDWANKNGYKDEVVKDVKE